jgi:hypothetical protein
MLGSYVDDSSLNDDDLLTDPSRTTNAFICINERNAGGNGVDDHVWISLIAVVIGTGDVVYDDFKDTHLRNELEVSSYLLLSRRQKESSADLVYPRPGSCIYRRPKYCFLRIG